jgi:putative salt-induced outer membrane protein YdiY
MKPKPACWAIAVAALIAAPMAAAQECPPCPPPPPPGWAFSVGGGLALTGGNSDTSSYNLVANVVYDPRKKNVFRGELLHLRTDEDGEATVDRTLAAVRDEYTLNGRLFVFGELGFQRDHFKQVDYLLAPVAGVGYKLRDGKVLLVAVDGGVGGAFEKLEGRDRTADFALRAAERLEWRPSGAVTVFHKATGLWKADDLGDAYYRFEIGAASTLARRLELKVSFADDYKSRPAVAGLSKNDTSLIVSLLFKS